MRLGLEGVIEVLRVPNSRRCSLSGICLTLIVNPSPQFVPSALVSPHPCTRPDTWCLSDIKGDAKGQKTWEQSQMLASREDLSIVHPSILPSFHPPAYHPSSHHLSIHPSIHTQPSVINITCSSIHLSFHPFICPFFYLSTQPSPGSLYSG